MKILYFLSGLTIIVLIIVVIIANLSVNPNSKVVIPTPQIVIKNVVKDKQVLATPTASSLPNLCIITIDGVKYDITSYKDIHSGGDIFTCGADMSATFWSRHNQRQLNQMQRYKI